jgi:hypothetical protein
LSAGKSLTGPEPVASITTSAMAERLKMPYGIT